MTNVEPTTRAYPPFSGDEPLCPKCGGTSARTEYLAHGRCEHGWMRTRQRCA